MRTLQQQLGFAIIFTTLCLVACAVTARADVKIKTRQTSGGQTYEGTTYIKDKRKRIESASNPVISVEQCDLRRELKISQQTKTYQVESWNQSTTKDRSTTLTAAAAPKTDQPQPTVPPAKGGVITMTASTKDTGERKQMFGYTARHIITTIEIASSPDACTTHKSKSETDGWYIDAAFAFDCATERYNGYQPESAKPGCRDRYETKQIGKAKTGYPVYEKMTMYDETGKETMSLTNEVVELSNATLDVALFDIPADYREVKDAQEMYRAISSASAAASDNPAATPINPTSGVSSGAAVATTPSGSNANESSLAVAKPSHPVVAAKKEGMIRIGVAMTKTTSVGEGLNAAMLSEAIRNTVVNYLTGLAVEVIALDARLPMQIDGEAKQKQCDYVVYTVASHKKGKSGGFGGFLKAASPLMDVVPMSGMASSTAGAVATTVVYTAANFAGSVKAKDELTLEYKLQNANSAPIAAASKTLKAKAKSDGDDLISQLVEQAATAILAEATKK